eukprot:TRINITY_DN77_c0_g1_i2.p1 TRINITY_DN77_c0_g1~~TRINITY_DN77_c0_g1_i2.p1  ORF type:complete len:194 (-),score=44.21 TRINITY_DN77_c0_g1_i2:59-640(-)
MSSPAPVNVPVSQSPSLDSEKSSVVVNKNKISLRKLLIGGAAMGAICLAVGLSVGLSGKHASSVVSGSHSSESSQSSGSSSGTGSVDSNSVSTSSGLNCVAHADEWTIDRIGSGAFCVYTDASYIDLSANQQQLVVSQAYGHTEGFSAKVYYSTESGKDCLDVAHGSTSGIRSHDVTCPPLDQESDEVEYVGN